MANKNNNSNNTFINNTVEEKIMGSFSKLSEDNQRVIITQYADEKNRGTLDKFFGTKKVAVYVATIICSILVIAGTAISIITFCKSGKMDNQLWEKIFPIVTLILGYIFGDNPKESK